jgi:protein ImuB
MLIITPSHGRLLRKYMPTRSKLFAAIISPDVKRDEEVLLSIAYGFAYRVEMLEDGVLFDVSGLEKLVGNTKKVALSILKKLQEHDISGNVGVAASIDAALIIARENTGLNHIAVTDEKFRQLHLSNLDIDGDTLGVFESLGISRIEDLQEIPVDELIARYGHDFRDLLDVINQSAKRQLTPNVKEKHVSWSYELDTAVDDFGQLIFILNRALDELLADITDRAMSTEQVDIKFKLEQSDRRLPAGEAQFKSYEIKTSFPTLDKNFWLKLINLRISVDPPQAEILSINVVAHFTKPRPSQTGLYAASKPQPESLLLTVGKIKKLVSDENVGVPVILQQRLERPFALDADKLPEGRESKETKLAPPVIAFAYYDPPIPAQVFVRNRQLIYLRTPEFAGRVLAYSGVWRSNSAWWGAKSWRVHEWHVEVENAGIYRLQKKGEEWFVVGEFD